MPIKIASIKSRIVKISTYYLVLRMATTRSPRNGPDDVPKSIYNYIGFQRRYNFVLWFIFAGAMLGCKLAAGPTRA